MATTKKGAPKRKKYTLEQLQKRAARGLSTGHKHRWAKFGSGHTHQYCVGCERVRQTPGR